MGLPQNNSGTPSGRVGSSNLLTLFLVRAESFQPWLRILLFITQAEARFRSFVINIVVLSPSCQEQQHVLGLFEAKC